MIRNPANMESNDTGLSQPQPIGPIQINFRDFKQIVTSGSSVNNLRSALMPIVRIGDDAMATAPKSISEAMKSRLTQRKCRLDAWTAFENVMSRNVAEPGVNSNPAQASTIVLDSWPDCLSSLPQAPLASEGIPGKNQRSDTLSASMPEQEPQEPQDNKDFIKYVGFVLPGIKEEHIREEANDDMYIVEMTSGDRVEPYQPGVKLEIVKEEEVDASWNIESLVPEVEPSLPAAINEMGIAEHRVSPNSAVGEIVSSQLYFTADDQSQANDGSGKEIPFKEIMTSELSVEAQVGSTLNNDHARPSSSESEHTAPRNRRRRRHLPPSEDPESVAAALPARRLPPPTYDQVFPWENPGTSSSPDTADEPDSTSATEETASVPEDFVPSTNHELRWENREQNQVDGSPSSSEELVWVPSTDELVREKQNHRLTPTTVGGLNSPSGTEEMELASGREGRRGNRSARLTPTTIDDRNTPCGTEDMAVVTEDDSYDLRSPAPTITTTGRSSRLSPTTVDGHNSPSGTEEMAVVTEDELAWENRSPWLSPATDNRPNSRSGTEYMASVTGDELVGETRSPEPTATDRSVGLSPATNDGRNSPSGTEEMAVVTEDERAWENRSPRLSPSVNGGRISSLESEYMEVAPIAEVYSDSEAQDAAGGGSGVMHISWSEASRVLMSRSRNGNIETSSADEELSSDSV